MAQVRTLSVIRVSGAGGLGVGGGDGGAAVVSSSPGVPTYVFVWPSSPLEKFHIPSDLVVDRWAHMLRAAQPVISR